MLLQIREAQEIASSMQRSYVVCFFFKVRYDAHILIHNNIIFQNLFNCFVLVGCAYTDENHFCRGLVIEMPYHFIESAYTGVNYRKIHCVITNSIIGFELHIVLSSVLANDKSSETQTKAYRARFGCMVCIITLSITTLIWRSTKVEPGSIADIRMSYKDRTEADVYFESLNKTWT